MIKTDNSNKPFNKRHKALNGALCLLALSLLGSWIAQPLWAVKPVIPGANRYQKDKVFLEYADSLIMDEKISPDYQILLGNVKFRKGDMFMYCDSAHFYDKENRFNAYSNVRMEQGDTLFVFADQLFYNGNTELAKLRYNVKMEHKSMTLFTDSFDYDLVANIGFYFEGGRIFDEENELTSAYGQYAPDTKDVDLMFDVVLNNEQYDLYTDTLRYNTETKIADIVGYTEILSDSNTIYSDNGWYNTASNLATLYNRSLIVGKDGQTLTGDTIYYDRGTGYGEVFGNMVLTDTAKSIILKGDYGFHNEKTDSSFATKRALAMEFSQKDTLYLHGDTIRTFLMMPDSTRAMNAYYNVRFFRSDVQGICDSLSFMERDSMMYMHRHPVLWNLERQVTGNVIKIHFNDSTADVAYLPEYGMLVEHVADEFYNQLSGKEMTAYLDGKSIRQLDVSGNVMSIMLPMEKDSTYNKLVNAEGSFLTVKFNGQQMEKLNMWPDVTGKVTPLFLTKRSQIYLKDFKWHDDIRPKDKDDIYEVPDAMRELLSAPETAAPKTRIRKEEEGE